MKYSRRSRRRPGKEVVGEPDNEAKYIDVNDEPSDDDFVDTGGKNSHASGKGMRNWDLRLNSNHVKLQKQLIVLCKKYAATILMFDCNVLKEQVKAQMEHASGSMLSDLEIGKGHVKIK
nr:hypothetical protein [Tanacetum cinerariifolium]